MLILENRYFDVIIEEMSSFLDSNGFKKENGLYLNEKYALKIEYDEAKQVYNLSVAANGENGVGEFKLISAYLFDESQTKNDAVSVAIDFVDTAQKALGLKSGYRGGAAVDLPSAQGASVTVSTLTAKLLANYPELKEVYKSEVDEKGKYLYLDFSARYFIPEIRKTLDEKNKKAVKKLIDMLCEMFVTGDRATTDLVIALLVGAIGKDAERFKTATEKMEDCPHLITAVNNEVAILVKSKKFAKALGFTEETL